MKALRAAGERSLAKVQVLPLFFLAAVLSCGAPYQFSADVEMVVLQATVRDQKDSFPSGLRQEDFRVYEDGKLQAIRLFQHQDVPVSVGLLVDNSGSMRPRRRDVAAAARALVRRSNPEDEMFIVNFNDRVSMGLPVTKLFSADSSELEQALSNASTGGRTALYDALSSGIERLRAGTGNKKVLIVISDGGDNASRHTLAEILQQAERSDVMIYTVGLFEEYDMDQNPRMLKRLARQTGGQAFFPKKISDVLPVCERIAADIRSQYTIGYVPTNRALDGTYRAIKVTAKAPGHATLFVRTRAGYLASPNQELGPAAPPEEIK